MPSVAGLLEQRELVARHRVDELREEADRVQAELVVAEQEWQEWTIARSRVGEVLAPADGAGQDHAGADLTVPAAEEQTGTEAPPRRAKAGSAVISPPKIDDDGAPRTRRRQGVGDVASLIRRQEYPVNVDYNGWALQDFDDTQVPMLFPEGFEGDTFLTAHPGRLDFCSAGHTHTASLTVDVWDGEPAVPAGEWDETALAGIVCSSGKLRARGMAAGPMPEAIELSAGPGVWTVRVMCTGREAAFTQTQHGVVHGVERYIAQFWPNA